MRRWRVVSALVAVVVLALPPAAVAAPSVGRNFEGPYETNVTPPAPQSAIGTSRFVELVHLRYAIFKRDSDINIATGPITDLTGGGNLSPQVIWDPSTDRFYFAAADINGPSVFYGWSTTASPNSAADWCSYSIQISSNVNDIVNPVRLGDTKDFVLMGLNLIDGNTGDLLEADVAWGVKPGPGSSCLPQDQNGIATGLTLADGSPAWLPAPANQEDPSSTGWIVATPQSLPAKELSLFKVKVGVRETADIQLVGTKLAVPKFAVPNPAPNPGGNKPLETFDGSLGQVTSAIDPLRGGLALWAQHTVKGGAGAEVRWYEIDPAAHTLFQSGAVTDATTYYFNGSISPDREVRGATKLFGSAMVMGVNASSHTQVPLFETVSKIGDGAQSAPVLVKASDGPYEMFDCISTLPCRWGEGAGASPDPKAPTDGATGVVWLTNEWAHRDFDTSLSGWRIWNAIVTP